MIGAPRQKPTGDDCMEPFSFHALSFSQRPQRAKRSFATRRPESCLPSTTPPSPWALLAVRSFLYETLLFVRRLQIVVFVTQTKKKATSKHESAEGCRRGFGNRRMIWRGGRQLSQKLTRVFFLWDFEMRPRSSGLTSPSSRNPTKKKKKRRGRRCLNASLVSISARSESSESLRT